MVELMNNPTLELLGDRDQATVCRSGISELRLTRKNAESSRGREAEGGNEDERQRSSRCYVLAGWRRCSIHHKPRTKPIDPIAIDTTATSNPTPKAFTNRITVRLCLDHLAEFSDGRSTPEITRNSTEPRCPSSRIPSCSGSAVNNVAPASAAGFAIGGAVGLFGLSMNAGTNVRSISNSPASPVLSWTGRLTAGKNASRRTMSAIEARSARSHPAPVVKLQNRAFAGGVSFNGTSVLMQSIVAGFIFVPNAESFFAITSA